MRRGILRLDAAESAFFTRELEHIEQRIFEIKYPELLYARLIPTRTGFDEAALRYLYRMFDEFGAAEIIHDKSQRFPRVDVKGSEYSGPVRVVGAEYGYSIMELKGAAKAARDANRPAGLPMLDQARAAAARKAIFRKLDTTAFLGHAVSGVEGLFAHSAIVAANVANGVSASPLWSNKTTKEILTDLNTPFSEIRTDTDGIEEADTLALPISAYTFLSMTPYGVDSDRTILEWWKQANPGKMVEQSHRLETAGAGNTRRMMAYKRNPDVLELLNPHGFQQLEPQRHGTEYTVDAFMTTAGVIVRFPKACKYKDGF